MKSTSKTLTVITLALAGSLVVASPAAAGVGDAGGLLGGLLGSQGLLGGLLGSEGLGDLLGSEGGHGGIGV